jgi:hypothetical protein
MLQSAFPELRRAQRRGCSCHGHSMICRYMNAFVWQAQTNTFQYFRISSLTSLGVYFQDKVARLSGACPFSHELHWRPDRFIFPECLNSIRSLAAKTNSSAANAVDMLRELQARSQPLCPASHFLWPALDATCTDCSKWIRVKCSKVCMRSTSRRALLVRVQGSACDIPRSGQWSDEVSLSAFVKAQQWAAERSRCPSTSVMRWVPLQAFYTMCDSWLTGFCATSKLECTDVAGMKHAQTSASRVGVCPAPWEFFWF